MPENTLLSKKGSDSKFDILKLFMSFFVVAIHMALFPMALYPWLRMAVPLFFIMTGYFFFKKVDTITDYKMQLKAVKNFVIRNLMLYAFWTAVFLPYILYIRRSVYFGNDSIIENVFAIVRAVLFSGTFTASWYIVASIYGVVIMFFLLRKLKNSVLLSLAVVLYIIISLSSSYKSIIFQSELVQTVYNTFCTYIEVPATSFLVAVVWLICGKCFADGMFKGNKLVYLILTIVSAVLLYAEWLFVMNIDSSYNNDCYIMLFPFCISVFGLINSCAKISFKYSINVRRLSTVVFVTHGFVARMTTAFFRNILHLDLILLCYMITILGCICIYIVLEFLYTRYKGKWLGALLKYAF